MFILKMFLIYPYWNVNLNPDVNIPYSNMFLIYPYWNVNALSIRLELIVVIVSNLSILECKFSGIRS